MAAAKIHLSKEELALVTNSSHILMRRDIISKVSEFFGELHHYYQSLQPLQSGLFTDLHEAPSGKLSKGENYKGLPYVVLDYPAIFHKEGTLAIRTFFWWGNFFSISFQASGKYLDGKLWRQKALDYFEEKKFFVSIHPTMWEHTFDSFNYLEIKNLSTDQHINILNKNFFKVVTKIDLNQLNEAPDFLKKAFRELISFNLQ